MGESAVVEIDEEEEEERMRVAGSLAPISRFTRRGR
jgi:hypothetical protein